MSRDQIKNYKIVRQIPEADLQRGFHIFPQQLYWHDGKSFESAHKAGVVREMQWSMKVSSKLNRVPVSIMLVKTYRKGIDKFNRRDFSREVKERLNSYKGYVRLARETIDELLALSERDSDTRNMSRDEKSKVIREQLPAVDTLFEIDWDNSDASKGKPHEDSDVEDMWTGRVIDMPAEQLAKAGADLCLLITKPRDSKVFRSSYNQTFPEKTINLPKCYMYAKIETVPWLRQLWALGQISDESKPELKDVQTALLHSMKNVAKIQDLREGPSRGRNAPTDALDRQSRRDRYDGALTQVSKARGFHQGQLDPLNSASQVPDKFWSVHGAPGTQKTGMIADLAALLVTVGHCVWICADSNAATNKAAKRCYKTFKDYESIIPELKSKKGLRFAPLGAEAREIKAWAARELSGELFNSTERKYNHLEDPFMLESILEDTSEDVDEYLAHQQAQTKHGMEEIETEYKYMTFEKSRKLEYPMKWSMVYRVRELMAQDEAQYADLTREDAVNPTAKYSELMAEADEGAMSNEKYDELVEARVNLFARVIAESDIVLTTSNNAGSTTVQEAINHHQAAPTVLILEKAGQVSVPSAAVPLTICPWDAIYAVGDLKQLAPVFLALKVCELAAIMLLSIPDILCQKGFPALKLIVQTRMAPSIVQFINGYFYDNEIKNHGSVINPTDPRTIFIRQAVRNVSLKLGIHGNNGQGSEYFGVNTMYGRAVRVEGSPSLMNRVGAKVMVQVAKMLVAEGVRPEDISMICFYRGQLKMIDFYRDQEDGLEYIERDTTDAFQGKDNHVVLVDIVTSASLSREEGGGVSAVGRNPLRLNVALSRGRDGCIVVGSMSNMISAYLNSKHHTDAREGALAAMVQDLAQRDLIAESKEAEPREFMDKVYQERFHRLGSDLSGLAVLAQKAKLRRREEKQDVQPVYYVSQD